MTTEAFDRRVTEEINRRVAIYARQYEADPQTEYQALLEAAEAYEVNAQRHDEEAEKLRRLASDAKAQAETLRRKRKI